MHITLIHALRHSPLPINAAFARLWPEAALRNLLDDSLSADAARSGGIGEGMTRRFLTLSRYAVESGTDAILFTCSAFGPCIEACAAEFAPLPVLKPNEAMIEQVSGGGHRIGLVATFAPTLRTLPAEFPPHAAVVPALARGALAALDRGDGATHDRVIAETAAGLNDCDVIALAQFSMARAAEQVRAITGKPVFTTPEAAVTKLRLLASAWPA